MERRAVASCCLLLLCLQSAICSSINVNVAEQIDTATTGWMATLEGPSDEDYVETKALDSSLMLEADPPAVDLAWLTPWADVPPRASGPMNASAFAELAAHISTEAKAALLRVQTAAKVCKAGQPQSDITSLTTHLSPPLN